MCGCKGDAYGGSNMAMTLQVLHRCEGVAQDEVS